MDQLNQLTRHLEFVSAKAWPAEEYRELDGWTIRATKGITWRANSVYPHSPLEDYTLENAIQEVIEFYNQRNIPPAFKLTQFSYPKNLDQALDEYGFKKEMETYVQTTPISSNYDRNGKFSVQLSNKIEQDWILAYKRLGDFNDFTLTQRLGIIKRIESSTAFASVRAGGEIVGIGMGVCDYDMLGLFGIVTDPKHRGKGIGTSINEVLLDWGRLNGARVSYLQVEKRNEPALSLYSKCGFRTVYDYWYRILRSS